MDKYLVVGNPIAQSKSPLIHQLFANQANIQISYDKLLTDEGNFSREMQSFFNAGGRGANITAPFKQLAFALCDQLSVDAKAAAAVNTLSYQDGKIIGDNTDGRGLIADLLDHKVSLQGKRVLLMGAGGASRGVILPILRQQPKQLTIVNRTQAKADELVTHFAEQRLSAAGYSDIGKNQFDIIINATSASLSSQLPPISPKAVSGAVCYDMVYSKQLTPFLQWCTQYGAVKTIDGLGMLVGQAAASFTIWHNCEPNVAAVLQQLRGDL